MTECKSFCPLFFARSRFSATDPTDDPSNDSALFSHTVSLGRIRDCGTISILRSEAIDRALPHNIVFIITLLGYSSVRDVSGFVRLFYSLSKNKIFRIFGRHILDFWPIISRFS